MGLVNAVDIDDIPTITTTAHTVGLTGAVGASCKDTKGALERRTCIDLLFICVRPKRPKAAGELPDAMCIWLQLKPVTYHLCQSLINTSTLLLAKVTRPGALPYITREGI